MEAFVFSPFAVLSLHVTKLWNSAQFNWQSSRLCCVLGGTGRIQQRWRRVRPHRREEVRGRPGGFGQLDEERKKSKGQDSISWESVYNRKFLPNPQIHQLHQYSGSSCRGRNCYQREKKKADGLIDSRREAETCVTMRTPTGHAGEGWVTDKSWIKEGISWERRPVPPSRMKSRFFLHIWSGRSLNLKRIFQFKPVFGGKSHRKIWRHIHESG